MAVALIGEDARRLDAGRRSLTEGEQVAAARPMSAAESIEQMRRRFGLDWQRAGLPASSALVRSGLHSRGARASGREEGSHD
jgi:hypothetical protein